LLCALDLVIISLLAVILMEATLDWYFGKLDISIVAFRPASPIITNFLYFGFFAQPNSLKF